MKCLKRAKIEASINWFLSWHIKKGAIPFITKDGKEITTCRCMQRLWIDAGLRTSKPEREIISTLESYFSYQYVRMLKDLEHAEAKKSEKVAEPGKEGIGGKNVSIRDIRNSKVIIQLADKAKQEATTCKDRYEELKEVLQLLKESVDKLGLGSQRKTELQEQIKEIDREMSSSKPNDKFITKCLGFVKGILAEVPSHMIAIQLVERIKDLKTLF